MQGIKEKERPEVPQEEIIEVNNTKKIDFKKPYRFIYTQWWFNLYAVPFYLLAYFTGVLCSIFFLGLKVVDRKKVRKLMRKRGCIIVSNHCHYFDTVYASMIQFPRRVHVSVVQRNFEVPIVRRILRLVFAFPIPSSASGLKMITKSIGDVLKRKQHVLFLPEGNLVYLSQTIYKFRLGAFQQSYYHQAPIVPMVYVLKRRRIFGKEMPRNWVKMICIFGDPIMPVPLTDDCTAPKKELQEMADWVADWMENTIQTYQAKFNRAKTN